MGVHCASSVQSHGLSLQNELLENDERALMMLNIQVLDLLPLACRLQNLLWGWFCLVCQINGWNKSPEYFMLTELILLNTSCQTTLL